MCRACGPTGRRTATSFATPGCERVCHIVYMGMQITLWERIVDYVEGESYQYKIYRWKNFPIRRIAVPVLHPPRSTWPDGLAVDIDYSTKPALLILLMAGEVRRWARHALLGYRHYAENGERRVPIKHLERRSAEGGSRGSGLRLIRPRRKAGAHWVSNPGHGTPFMTHDNSRVRFFGRAGAPHPSVPDEHGAVSAPRDRSERFRAGPPGSCTSFPLRSDFPRCSESVPDSICGESCWRETAGEPWGGVRLGGPAWDACSPCGKYSYTRRMVVAPSDRYPRYP